MKGNPAMKAVRGNESLSCHFTMKISSRNFFFFFFLQLRATYTQEKIGGQMEGKKRRENITKNRCRGIWGNILDIKFSFFFHSFVSTLQIFGGGWKL